MINLLNLIKSIFASIKNAVVSNPDVKRLVKEHPQFFSFLKKRLHWRDFSGLPLTFITITIIYLLFLFLGLITKILTTTPIVFLDVHLTNLFYTYRNALLTEILYWVTLSASWQIMFIGTIIFLIIFWIWQKKTYILPFLLALSMGSILSYLGKIIIQRPRPTEVALYDLSSYSFPSSHATLSIIFYGFIAYFFIKNLKTLKYKVLVLFYTPLLIIAIGFSRIYLGFHFLSDVSGGLLLGGIALLIAITLTEWLLKNKQSTEKKYRIKFIKTTTVILGLVLICSWLAMGLFFRRSFELSTTPQITKINQQQIIDIFKAPINLPKHTETPTAVSQEPISFIIIAPNNKALINAFQQAGWTLADPPTGQAIIRIAKAIFLNQAYPNAPLTPSFWNGQVNNFGFEKPTDSQTARQRHHARFWRTNFITENNSQIYFGTASLDIGVKWGITHKIDPNIDAEREYLFTDLKTTKALDEYQKQPLIPVELGKNFIGDLYFTDGQAYILNLK